MATRTTEVDLPPLDLGTVPEVADVNVLPDWEVGTPGVLCAAGPHAIPVSTALRAGDHTILMALSQQRETFDILRHDPRAAFCLMGAGIAFSAYGMASVKRQELAVARGVAAVEIEVDRVQDHLADGRTDLIAGARWRWRTDRLVEDEQAIIDELIKLAL